MDNTPVSCRSLSTYYHVDGKQLEDQYRRHLSGFFSWDQLGHAEDWILFKENIGSHLSIDEVALTQGELYTVVTFVTIFCFSNVNNIIIMAGEKYN